MSPMPPPMESPAPTTLDDEHDPRPAPESGYMICIDVDGDGSFAVHKEEKMSEQPEMPSEGPDAMDAPEDSGQRIDSIEGVLKAVLGIYRENPPEGNGEAQMAEGFGPPGQMGGE